MVVNGYKDIENRSWSTKHRGKILIHASSRKVTKTEYAEFKKTCWRFKITVYPAVYQFMIGGIVGSVEIVDCVEKFRSPWFFGPHGFPLKNARKLLFKPMNGKLHVWSV